MNEADRVLNAIEAEVERSAGPLPAPLLISQAAELRTHWHALFKRPYG